MKKLKKRLHDVNLKMERYTCAECLPASCYCYNAGSKVLSDNYLYSVTKNENESYRRS